MPGSDVPKYLSIADDLRRRISDAEFSPGERLPAQHALAEEYGVTLMTLRHALTQLESEVLIHAAKGKGTFVSEPTSVRYDLEHLWSFGQEMTHQGVDVATEVLRVGPVPDTGVAEMVRDALGLDVGEAVVELVRRRSISAQPVVLQRSFLAASRWSQISSADFVERSLYDVLADVCGLVIARASETIRAVGLDAGDAAILGAEPGLAALESVRVSRTAEGSAFLYDRALLRGAATEIRTERSAEGMRAAYSPL